MAKNSLIETIFDDAFLTMSVEELSDEGYRKTAPKDWNVISSYHGGYVDNGIGYDVSKGDIFLASITNRTSSGKMEIFYEGCVVFEDMFYYPKGAKSKNGSYVESDISNGDDYDKLARFRFPVFSRPGKLRKSKIKTFPIYSLNIPVVDQGVPVRLPEVFNILCEFEKGHQPKIDHIDEKFFKQYGLLQK